MTINALASTLSTFSSLGLTAGLGFKPDLAAPGGSIYSTWPLELGGYASLSGTSRASPHVAGAAALLLEARPGLSATDVREISENNAVTILGTTPPVRPSPSSGRGRPCSTGRSSRSRTACT